MIHWLSRTGDGDNELSPLVSSVRLSGPGVVWLLRRTRTGTGGLNRPERDADTALLAPRDMAGQMQSIARYNQYETLGDPDLVGYLQRGTGRGQVANQAINGAAAELDRSLRVSRATTEPDQDRRSP
jgi:hypothetical protein